MPELPKVLAMLLMMFISLIPSAEAFDGGDAVALLLGVTISVVGVCAECDDCLSFHEILTLPCQVNCHLSTGELPLLKCVLSEVLSPFLKLTLL
uniref:Uncharacterized protein n=1 Tax=Salmo trutta TaxID=8032 RepID=A0A673XS60_SALTR